MRLHEYPWITGDTNQPLSIAYCEALIFTLNALDNQQLLQLYEDTNAKLRSLEDEPEVNFFYEGLLILDLKIQTVATKRYNLNNNCAHLTHILSI
jgi:hypothetical protein